MSARRKVYGRKESLFLVGGICFCIGFGFYWRWEGQKEMEGESGEVLIEEARVSGKEGKDIVEKV
ncbi:predicted protein [Sclerotinia sclerotiorum 1980 UF-70]|uniref:Uncharacterized protein n=1 Tax=Sclerotinia sclerotiorum (strain ATCC 18683 / 1980 / Ss-1) TaxID=665079 RepID=A7EHE9_SCLS1|nr:predicted protein [Sclerotinia sclerotiorum 1980 UF-70]EDO02265.1 predicted protein [Sclerotinia sclerotiorum 1980 UF-70]